MPFYRRLTSTAKSAGARVVAVTYENPDENRAYLSDQGVEVDAAVSNIVNSLPIEGTPTLVLVGRDGKVINSWLGKLTEGEEKSILGAISPGN
jgi:thioredoxin-related protein